MSPLSHDTSFIQDKDLPRTANHEPNGDSEMQWFSVVVAHKYSGCLQTNLADTKIMNVDYFTPPGPSQMRSNVQPRKMEHHEVTSLVKERFLKAFRKI